MFIWGGQVVKETFASSDAPYVIIDNEHINHTFRHFNPSQPKTIIISPHTNLTIVVRKLNNTWLRLQVSNNNKTRMTLGDYFSNPTITDQVQFSDISSLTYKVTLITQPSPTPHVTLCDCI